ncbi:MAG: radical SAM protein [Bacteroidales bacterium]|nr:radical SAM protein [Bacteroidales bacterium]
MLFNQIVFGPIKSRRLGISLGINLLPANGKLCTFNCIYCECGYNADYEDKRIPTREEVRLALDAKLNDMKSKGECPDVITFSGNGEPTLHHDFAGIIDDTIILRNKYFPEAKISVLSNSTCIHKESVFKALCKVDNNILKLDAASQELVNLIDQPTGNVEVEKLVENLRKFNGNVIIQTIFLRGEHNGVKFDNTTDEHVNSWLEAIKKIQPKQIMIYAIDRATPEKNLEKITVDELKKIAQKARVWGFDVMVAG